MKNSTMCSYCFGQLSFQCKREDYSQYYHNHVNDMKTRTKMDSDNDMIDTFTSGTKLYGLPWLMLDCHYYSDVIVRKTTNIM